MSSNSFRSRLSSSSMTANWIICSMSQMICSLMILLLPDPSLILNLPLSPLPLPPIPFSPSPIPLFLIPSTFLLLILLIPLLLVCFFFFIQFFFFFTFLFRNYYLFTFCEISSIFLSKFYFLFFFSNSYIDRLYEDSNWEVNRST